MTEEKKKTEPPLALSMSFDEALARFAVTKPLEVSDSVERAKTKKPPQDFTPRRPVKKAPLPIKTEPKEPKAPTDS